MTKIRLREKQTFTHSSASKTGNGDCCRSFLMSISLLSHSTDMIRVCFLGAWLCQMDRRKQSREQKRKRKKASLCFLVRIREVFKCLLSIYCQRKTSFTYFLIMLKVFFRVANEEDFFQRGVFVKNKKFL